MSYKWQRLEKKIKKILMILYIEKIFRKEVSSLKLWTKSKKESENTGRQISIEKSD
jgi:hypothetical protein